MFGSELKNIVNDGIVTDDAAKYLVTNPEAYLTLIKTEPALAHAFALHFKTEDVDNLVKNAHKNNNKILSKIAAIPTDFSTKIEYKICRPELPLITEVCKLYDPPQRTYALEEQIIRQHLKLTAYPLSAQPEVSTLYASFPNCSLTSYLVAGQTGRTNQKPDRGGYTTATAQDGSTYYKKWNLGSHWADRFTQEFYDLKAFAEVAATSISILNRLLKKISPNIPSAEPNLDTGYLPHKGPNNIFKSTLYVYQLKNLQPLLEKSDSITSLQELLKHGVGEEPIFSQLVEMLPDEKLPDEKLSDENHLLVASILGTVANRLGAINENDTKAAAEKRAIVASMPDAVLQKIAARNTPLAWEFINAAPKQLEDIHSDFYKRVWNDHTLAGSKFLPGKITAPSAPPAIPEESQGSSSTSNSARAQVAEQDEQAAEKDNSAAMTAAREENTIQHIAVEKDNSAAISAAREENTIQHISVFMYMLSEAANLGRKVIRGLLHPLLESSEEQETQDDEPEEAPPAYEPPATNPAASAPPAFESETNTPPASVATTAPSYRARLLSLYPNLRKDTHSTVAKKTQTDSTQNEKDDKNRSGNAPTRNKKNRKIAIPT